MFNGLQNVFIASLCLFLFVVLFSLSFDARHSLTFEEVIFIIFTIFIFIIITIMLVIIRSTADFSLSELVFLDFTQ